jgi:Zn-dependent protease with chaperone function
MTLQKTPKIPLWRIVSAILLVPGIYAVIAFSLVVDILASYVIILALWHLTEWLFGSVPLVIPVTLIGISLAVLVVTLWGIVRAFRNWPPVAPALRLNPAEEVEFFTFLNDLCRRMNAKVPDSVVFHADTNFLIQEGGLMVYDTKVNGRVLVMGLPVISFINVSELRAILSHELAHFTGNDRLFSSYVIPQYQRLAVAIGVMSETLGVVSGAAKTRKKPGCLALPLILTWFLLNLYWMQFHKINLRISLSRELMADGAAAIASGSTSLKRALHITAVVRSRFKEFFKDFVEKSLHSEQTYINYCQAFRASIQGLDPANSVESVEFISEGQGEIDTHPPLGDRIGMISDIQVDGIDQRPAKQLFHRLNYYEEKITVYLADSILADNVTETGTGIENAAGETTARTQGIVCAVCSYENPESEMYCQRCGAGLAD